MINKTVLFTCLFTLCPAGVMAQEVLDKLAVEKVFQDKLVSYQELISDKNIPELQKAIKDFTHEDTIILLEFSMKMPDMEPLPAQKAYFNRDPFIELFKNAQSLDPESFEITYQLDKFQPQYGGGSAIIHDSGTAKGTLDETFSGDSYKFSMSQKCRNTISADAETTFKVDSVYCRMEIEYEPVHKIIVPVDGEEEIALEKPAIDDIISEIEEKKREAAETE